MKIIYSKHAERKITERKIEKKNIEKTLKNPDFIFYDLYTKNLINITKIEVSTNLAVSLYKAGRYS